MKNQPVECKLTARCTAPDRWIAVCDLPGRRLGHTKPHPTADAALRAAKALALLGLCELVRDGLYDLPGLAFVEESIWLHPDTANVIDELLADLAPAPRPR